MKVKFWLATYAVWPPLRATGSTAQPMLASDVNAIAIEVIRYDDQWNMAVLLSTLVDPTSPYDMTCRIGLANGAKASNDWRDRGFPLVDAAIDLDVTLGKLSIRSPFFAPEKPAMCYQDDLLTIEGVSFDPSGTASDDFPTRYDQSIDVPDYLAPATSILRKRVCWELKRSGVTRAGKLMLKFGPQDAARSPDLQSIKVDTAVSAWTGDCEGPDMRMAIEPARPRRLSRADTFGVPAFRFDDVEVVGFRIELDALARDYRDKLDDLIKPLNFHLDTPTGEERRNPLPDFRYVPATSTLIVELLRYGRMRLKTQEPPLGIRDYQSQHELLVRILVGRIDDDTAQARDAAVFVPAIFVDNPWSKILGREVQGFDKTMANFCAFDDGKLKPLLPDGSFDGQTRVPLTQVRQIDLVNLFGSTADNAAVPIVELGYPQRPEQRGVFEDIDLDLALGGSSLSLTRWRQSDFADPEFRRSFARSAVRRTLKGFRSIQVAPIGARVEALDKTWITGSFVVDDTLQVARPSGVASLTLHSPPDAPAGWRDVCSMLGIEATSQRTLSFPAGSWYRMKCSMDLLIDNGLE